MHSSNVIENLVLLSGRRFQRLTKDDERFFLLRGVLWYETSLYRLLKMPRCQYNQCDGAANTRLDYKYVSIPQLRL
jgi:hypothetical protein